MGKDLIDDVYFIAERNRYCILGYYSTEKQVKSIFEELIKSYEKGNKKYEMPKDKNRTIEMV